MVTTFFPPLHFGGDAVFATQLANELAIAGHGVEIVHCADAFHLLQGGVSPSPLALHPAIRVHTISQGRASPVLTQITGRLCLKRKAFEEILRSGFDVVHFHNISLIGLDAIPMTKALRVCTLHDYWWICPTHILFRNGREACDSRDCISCQIVQRRPPQLWRLGSMMEEAARSIDLFLAPSEFVRQRYASTPPYIDAKVLPHFVRESSVPQRVESNYYLYAGRLERAKGLQEIIPVFLRTGRRLVIAGAGEFEPQLRKLAGASPLIEFLGRVQHSEMDTIYANARATIVPSICFETFGLTILESLQAGTPVITSSFGALPEVIRNTAGGFVYRDLNELEQILDQTDSPQFRGDWRAPDLRLFRPEAHLARYLGWIERARRTQ